MDLIHLSAATSWLKMYIHTYIHTSMHRTPTFTFIIPHVPNLLFLHQYWNIIDLSECSKKQKHLRKKAVARTYYRHETAKNHTNNEYPHLQQNEHIQLLYLYCVQGLQHLKHYTLDYCFQKNALISTAYIYNTMLNKISVNPKFYFLVLL